MLYFLLALSSLIAFYIWWEKKKQRDLKKHGVRVSGAIIENNETSADSKCRLGGNINTPTVKFHTESGVEIIGKPIIGFVSQKQVVVPSNIYIFYDKRNPSRFCLDIS